MDEQWILSLSILIIDQTAGSFTAWGMHGLFIPAFSKNDERGLKGEI
jgi:hypothetical protein